MTKKTGIIILIVAGLIKTPNNCKLSKIVENTLSKDEVISKLGILGRIPKTVVITEESKLRIASIIKLITYNLIEFMFSKINKAK